WLDDIRSHAAGERKTRRPLRPPQSVLGFVPVYLERVGGELRLLAPDHPRPERAAGFAHLERSRPRLLQPEPGARRTIDSRARSQGGGFALIPARFAGLAARAPLL